MNKSKTADVATALYVDHLHVVNLVDSHPNDGDLGEQLREYVQFCRRKKMQDEQFLNWQIAPFQAKTPAELNTQLLHLKQANNAAGY